MRRQVWEPGAIVRIPSDFMYGNFRDRMMFVYGFQEGGLVFLRPFIEDLDNLWTICVHRSQVELVDLDAGIRYMTE